MANDYMTLSRFVITHCLLSRGPKDPLLSAYSVEVALR